MFKTLTAARALQYFQVMRLIVLVFISIVLAKSNIGIAEIGVYETLTWLGTTLSLFWTVGLLQGFVTLYGHYRTPAFLWDNVAGNTPSVNPVSPTPLIQKFGIEYVTKAFIFNTFFVFCLLSLGLYILLSFGSSSLLFYLTGLSKPPTYYGWFCLYILFFIPSFIVEYIYLVHQRGRAIFLWGIISFGTQLLFLILPLQWGFGLNGAMIAWSIWSVFRFIWTCYTVYYYGIISIIPELIKEHLRFSQPLVLSIVVGNLILFFDNWLVGWYYHDESVFAIFRYGAREFPLATAMTGALGAAMIPQLTAGFPAGMEYLKKEGLRLMHLLFPLAMALMLVSVPLFPVIFNPGFAASASIFNIYLLVTASRLLLPATVVLALGKPKLIYYVGIIELLVKIITGFVFIQIWGLTGLAWSVVLSYWVEKIGLIWYLEKKIQIKTKDWLSIRTFTIYSLMLLTVWIILNF